MREYGLDIQDKLTSLLSEELAKSIDAQIMNTLMNVGMGRQDRARKILDNIKNMKENN